ncbi:MAG: type IV pilus assembly protein PilV, partial [Methylophagaceae bacterium]
NQMGFTLLEVLITLVILAIGLLGLASLQTTSIKSNYSAYHRSQATFGAYDIIDRMRSNNNSIGNYLTSFMAPTIAVAQAGCSITSGCSSAQMAQNDLFEWNTILVNTLPAGAGTITLAGSIYTITVNWDDDRNGAVNASDPNFQVSFQP